ncbi:proline-rich protein 2-like [Triticum dicoccoides]|uniref:proline-rich protein 2-like n=1 Tax=Triticum dicoccoides TaxID=85692 RepID=UPI00188DF804|nr:proline-rich protein 2-like [Triticum dicoccoides]
MDSDLEYIYEHYVESSDGSSEEEEYSDETAMIGPTRCFRTLEPVPKEKKSARFLPTAPPLPTIPSSRTKPHRPSDPAGAPPPATLPPPSHGSNRRAAIGHPATTVPQIRPPHRPTVGSDRHDNHTNPSSPTGTTPKARRFPSPLTLRRTSLPPRLGPLTAGNLLRRPLPTYFTAAGMTPHSSHTAIQHGSPHGPFVPDAPPCSLPRCHLQVCFLGSIVWSWEYFNAVCCRGGLRLRSQLMSGTAVLPQDPCCCSLETTGIHCYFYILDL